jgi:hypothetical protein
MAAGWPVNEAIRGFPCQQVGSPRSPLLWCLYRQDFTSQGRYYPHQWPRGASQPIMLFLAGLAPPQQRQVVSSRLHRWSPLQRSADRRVDVFEFQAIRIGEEDGVVAPALLYCG